MFAFSRTFTHISLAAAAAALSLSLAGTANAQTIGGNTVVGGFAKTGGAVRAVDINQGFADDTVAAQKSKAAKIVRRPATRLPSNLKTGIQNLSGTELSKVRVHSNTPNPANLGTKAFAKGGNIHIGPGQAKHLPHEAWHVVDQKQGRVRPQLRSSNSLKLMRQADALADAKRVTNSAKSAKTAATFASKAKSAQTVAKGAQAAKVARHAKTASNVGKGLKAANTARKAGRLATASTGVGVAVVAVDIAASMAGVNPADLAILKATDPAAYNAKMAALKKNPMKYMGNNIKDNAVKGLTNVGNATIKTGQVVGKAGEAVGNATKTAAANVGNATKKAATNVGNATKTAANKVGCGVGNMFKKKADKNKC